ncbi:MAG: TIGR01777 family oxidoreductase [Candidatus Paceibacterota bacterium]
MTIVVTGGSGFIGTTVSKRLLAQGHTVVVIALTPPSFTHQNLFFIQSDVATQPLPYNVLEQTDAIINLVGAPISVKWTEKNKKAIHDSRIKSTASIVEAIAASKSRPTVFICASASGFYGNTGEVIHDEQSPNGTGFLADVVMEWEAEARKATEFGVRVVCIRTSPVIGHGGLMSLIKKSAGWGFLPRLKKEDFWFSWISEMDIVNAYLFALETNTLQGVVNATAPEPVLYSTFLQSLKNIWKHRLVITIPQWLGKKMFNDGYFEMTNDSRVVPKRLVDKGFDFVYPTIESALAAYEKN